MRLSARNKYYCYETLVKKKKKVIIANILSLKFQVPKLFLSQMVLIPEL